MTRISFNVGGRQNMDTIFRIARRARETFAGMGGDRELQEIAMDISAVHANGCPLRLYDLEEADDFNFRHDIFGIYRHLDRETGHLKNCFVPRFAAHVTVTSERTEGP